MYGGAGLQTPRGSGTSGYVQTNKFLRAKPHSPSSKEGAAGGVPGAGRGPSGKILEHDRKRRVELRLLVLEEGLVDQGCPASDIAARLAEARAAYEAEAAAISEDSGDGGERWRR